MTTPSSSQSIDEAAGALTEVFTTEFWEDQLQFLFDQLQFAILALIVALILLFIGWIFIKIVLWLIGKALKKANLDPTVRGFILSIAKVFLWMIVIVTVLDAINIKLVSMVMIIGALMLAISLSLSDMMVNFVSGLIILTYKHFKVGDFIEAQGIVGTVKEITMTATNVLTIDNRVATIPNNKLAIGVVCNYNRQDLRRVDLVIGVAYDADLDQAKKILKKVCKSCDMIVTDPNATTVEVHELGDSAVNIVVRPWCKPADYWSVHWYVHEHAKKQLDKANIGIPFPQLDLHLFNEGSSLAGLPKPTSKPAAAAADTTEDTETEEEEYEYEYETED